MGHVWGLLLGLWAAMPKWSYPAEARKIESGAIPRHITGIVE